MSQIADISSKDIPEFFINLIVSGWLLLFGVRSLIVTPLVWNQTLTAEQLAALDPILLKIYLILFSLTLLVAALRLVRHAERKPQA